MYLFIAHYIDVNTFKKRRKTIEFDGDNFFNTESECWKYAIDQAMIGRTDTEIVDSIELEAC